MTRDLLGNRIKRHLIGVEQVFMEKFYIHNGKIYQIVRIVKKGDKLNILYRNPKIEKKVKSYTISYNDFLKRKHYHTYRKAQIAK